MCPNKTAVLLPKGRYYRPFGSTEFSALRGSVDQGFASGLFAESFNLLKNLQNPEGGNLDASLHQQAKHRADLREISESL